VDVEKPSAMMKPLLTRQKNINAFITSYISEWARVGIMFGNKNKNDVTPAGFEE
jgi:hypothetical protein